MRVVHYFFTSQFSNHNEIVPGRPSAHWPYTHTQYNEINWQFNECLDFFLQLTKRENPKGALNASETVSKLGGQCACHTTPSDGHKTNQSIQQSALGTRLWAFLFFLFFLKIKNSANAVSSGFHNCLHLSIVFCWMIHDLKWCWKMLFNLIRSASVKSGSATGGIETRLVRTGQGSTLNLRNPIPSSPLRSSVSATTE